MQVWACWDLWRASASTRWNVFSRPTSSALFAWSRKWCPTWRRGVRGTLWSWAASWVSRVRLASCVSNGVVSDWSVNKAKKKKSRSSMQRNENTFLALALFIYNSIVLTVKVHWLGESQTVSREKEFQCLFEHVWSARERRGFPEQFKEHLIRCQSRTDYLIQYPVWLSHCSMWSLLTGLVCLCGKAAGLAVCLLLIESCGIWQCAEPITAFLSRVLLV